MANKLYDETAIQNIANAIREKNGSTDTYKVSEMASAIGEISGLDNNVVTFSQMNDKVTAYLADADAQYTDTNGDTVSVMANHRQTTGDKDRPVGLEITAQSGTRYLHNETDGNGGKQNNLIGGKSIIYNAIPNKVSQYLVKDSNGNLLDNGRIKPTGKVRMIRFYGNVRNCRDLGGWACDGGTVKYGQLFRSAVIGSMESVDYNTVKELNIKHEIDLREDDELTYTESQLGSTVHYHHHPLGLYYANAVDPNGESYESIKGLLHTAFDAVTHGEGVNYHCAIGRDRTGTVTVMLLGLLGVAIKDIDKDFELTSFSQLDTNAPRTLSEYRGMITYLKSLRGSTLRDGIVKWYLNAGFTIDEINAFRSAMIDGTPTVLKAEDYTTTYTITQTLSNCTSNISQSTITENAPLSVTITAKSGYELSTLTVTMGGVNITSSAVSGNEITISKVTGNVVITATAIDANPNQIPLSINADGTPFVEGKGWKTGYYIRVDTYAETAKADYECTGFIPCTQFDTFEITNVRFEKLNNDNITLYDSSFTKIGFFSGGSSTNPLTNFGTFDSNNRITSVKGRLMDATTTNITAANMAKVAYIRISAYGITNNTVCTIKK